MAYELLCEPIRRYIRDQQWDSLRPIQAAAITRILATDDHYILASRTASGKTEAAFLPVLSKLNRKEPGVQVLYISPLIALINDQFERAGVLCKYLDVPVTKWHGEASRAAKEKLLKNPAGVVLITPESIEALFVNHPASIKQLFSHLQFIIIDEIHSFLGSNRGLHLKSLLSRLAAFNTGGKARIIGLSATIGDYAEAKRFTGNAEKTRVLVDKTAKAIEARFCFRKLETGTFPNAFIEQLYEEVKNRKVLIFPNNRGKAEELAVKLKQVAVSRKGHPFYFSHHSSVDKDVREYVEDFAKHNKRNHFCIACTSTLELGIDIGTVDVVVQIDSAHAIASLIQRVGRSGRREGASSQLLLYATDEWELLQSLACWELYQAGFVEPVDHPQKPFDLLFHQILSILKETNGMTRPALLDRIKTNTAFERIPHSDADNLLQYMVDQNFIEVLGRELIVGYEGEKLTGSRDFYSVFTSPQFFKVIHSGRPIGEIPLTPAVMVDSNMYLSAGIWKVKDIDFRAKKIAVVPARDGKRPLYEGSGGDVHPRIREKMLELLFSDVVPITADLPALDALQELRMRFNHISIEELLYDRPCVVTDRYLVVYTFTGTRINRTLSFLLSNAAIRHVWHERQSCFEIAGIADTDELIALLLEKTETLEQDICRIMTETPDVFELSKWGTYLPSEWKRKYVFENYFDDNGTRCFIEKIRLLKGRSNP